MSSFTDEREHNVDVRPTGANSASGSARRYDAWRSIVLIVATAAIGLGVFARVDSLDRKVLWFDESFSLLRISGHSEAALHRLFDGKIHRSDELLALQHVTPALGMPAMFASLREEPQRGPLYYVLARLWIDTFGNGIAAVRSLSVVLGLIGIGLAFMLGRTLVASVEGGMVFAALVALSPIQIRFSQQVREYILVADLTLLATYLAVRALESPRPLRWLVLGICGLAGLFTNATFGFLLAAQFVAIAVAAYRDRLRRRAIVVGAVSSLGGAIAVYLPFALAAAHSASSQSVDLVWVHGAYPLRAAVLKWAFNVGAVFFDSEYARNAWGAVLVPLFVVVAAAATFVVRRAVATSSARMIVAVTVSTSLPVIALDVLRHAHYELIARYQMATWLGIGMLVAYAVATNVYGASSRWRAPTACSFAFVCMLGAVAIFVDRSYTEWWDNNDHLSESIVAHTIDSGEQPALVVASGARDTAYDTFVLGRYLASGTAMLLYGDSVPTIAPGYPVVYLFTPSRSALDQIERRLRVAPVNVSPSAGLTVPELNAARNATAESVSSDNALWRVRPRAAYR